jgi:hypothetical protein
MKMQTRVCKQDKTTADLITSKKPFFFVNKILLNYTQELLQVGYEGSKRFFGAFERTLILIKVMVARRTLTSERDWEKSDGQNLNNQIQYPLFYTITCEFCDLIIPYDLLLENTPTGIKGWRNHDYNHSIYMGQFSAENFNVIRKLLSYDSNSAVSIAEHCELLKIAAKLNQQM